MPEDAQKKAELTVILMFFIALAAAGLVLIGVTVRDFARARASFAWPRVEGVVLSDPQGAGLRYVYVAGGENHESRRIGFFRTPFLRGEYGDLAPGDKVSVYVDPADPSAAVLEPGGSSLVFLAMSLGAAFLVFVGTGGAIRTLMKGGVEDWLIDEEARLENDAAR